MLLLIGADSFAANPEKDGRVRHFQNARVIEYSQAGHWLHHDQHDRFVADLKAFIAD
jgi:pimeloyl-ACP methyl ester carboxylesterase